MMASKEEAVRRSLPALVRTLEEIYDKRVMLMHMVLPGCCTSTSS